MSVPKGEKKWFIDQKYTKIYINRTGKFEQIKAFGLCDLREI